MKERCFIIILCLISITASAQTNTNDSLNHKPTYQLGVGIRDPQSISYHKPLCIVDGFVRRNTKRVDPNTVDSIIVLKEKEAINKYGDKGRYGALVIFTKKYKANLYVNKLSAFSKRYKQYITENDWNDSHVLYVINGISTNVPVVKKDIIKLSELQTANIESVAFSETQSSDQAVRKPVVIIKIKE